MSEKKPDAKKRSLNIKVDISGFKETLINYIVPLVSLLLSAAIGFFILYPSYKDLPDLMSEIAVKSNLETNLRNKLNNLNRLVDFKSIVDENSNLVNKVLLSEELIPGLLTQVDRIARESGLLVSRLNYGLGATTESEIAGAISYNYVTINLGAVGSFAQLITFIENVENAARLINIDQFRYSLSTTDFEEVLGINFVLQSPYLYIESDAVTDDAIDLNISNQDFLDLINRVKNLKYYDPNFVDTSVPVIEAPTEEEEEAPTEGAESEESIFPSP